MFAQKLLLPACALLSVVAAQTSSCTKSTATFTINSQADVTQIADCETVAGSVVIGKEVVGPLQLDGPSAISGNFIVDGAVNMTGLSSSTIGSISTSTGAQWTLNDLTLMSTLSFTELTQVGTVYWAGLKALSTFTFPAFITKAGNITITNTFLTSLDGINLKSVALFDVNNNPRLKSLTTLVVNVTAGLNVAANGQSLVVNFPNLEFAESATFRNVSSLSVPSLASVGESLTLDECTFTTFSAPNLTTIGDKANRIGSLSIVGNPKLTNFTIPELVSVAGGLQVANNSALQSLAFPVLSTVGGAVDLSGNFTTPSLPELSDVAGAMNIQSTAVIDCTKFDTLKGNVVQGNEQCVSATNDPETLSPSGTTSGGSSSSTSKGAAVSYGINEAVAGLSVIGGLMQMLL